MAVGFCFKVARNAYAQVGIPPFILFLFSCPLLLIILSLNAMDYRIYAA